jgi:hypothetical protein
MQSIRNCFPFHFAVQVSKQLAFPPKQCSLGFGNAHLDSTSIRLEESLKVQVTPIKRCSEAVIHRVDLIEAESVLAGTSMRKTSTPNIKSFLDAELSTLTGA